MFFLFLIIYLLHSRTQNKYGLYLHGLYSLSSMGKLDLNLK